VSVTVAQAPTARRLQFEVPGIPEPQGSKDAHHHGGRTWVTETNKNLKPWRAAVTSAARDAMDPGFEPFVGPMRLTVTFSFPRPAGHFGTGRNAGQLKESAPRWVTSQRCGDLDKLIRGIGDALTAAGVWTDDSLVVSVMAMKGYAARPGAFIEVEEVGA
jgi:crossover junction endodeoxyribonuclease RusA